MDIAATSHAEDVIELRPFVVIGGDPAMDTFARHAHATLKRVFASNHLRIVERGGTPSQQVSRDDSEFNLSGTLEKMGDAYAVTLYFDDRAEAQTLWSERLTRAVADEANLREAAGVIAAGVVSCALRQRTKAPRKPTLQAFRIYLQLCDPKTWLDLGETGLVTAERLIAIAPDDPYGHGFAAFANSILAKDRPDLTPSQFELYAGAARKAAARALELDAKNEDALLAKDLLGTPLQYWLSLDELGERQAWMQAWGFRKSARVKEAIHAQKKTACQNALVARRPRVPCLDGHAGRIP